MFLERLASYVSPAKASCLLPTPQTLLPRVVWALLALSYLGTLANSVSASVNNSDVRPRAEGSRFVYEARVGLMVAGELDFSFSRSQHEYGFLGQFLTSKKMSEYYTWTGRFAAKGDWIDERPLTESYLVQSESADDDYKVVVMDDTHTQILQGRDSKFEILPKPVGVDLISALLFTQGCFTGDAVHDGEDSYPIRLREVSGAKLPRRRGFHSGDVTRCDYDITTRRGKERRLRVSMAQVDGFWVATEVRIRLTFFPDPVFRLRG